MGSHCGALILLIMCSFSLAQSNCVDGWDGDGDEVGGP